MRMLITGFEPFGGDSVNASGVVLERLAGAWGTAGGRRVAGVELETAVLPVEFVGAARVLAAAIAEARPDAVLCLGEAGGRSAVTPERWAGPTALGRIADNAGFAPCNEPLDGDAGLLASRLDVDAMVAAIRAAGVASHASEDAGRYVCNATFRALLRDHDLPGGFIHVPAVRDTGVALVGGETDDAEGERLGRSLDFGDLVDAVCAVIHLLAAG